jgi:MoaA/NifB/PqqE/SkfB family radical SAM enzyme
LFNRRPLNALQVEVTSRCTRECAICPRTALRSVWQDGDLSDASWDRLRPDLELARHVHLQGWGEPLLHPRISGMVDAAKAAGNTVGITTNGDLLHTAIDWIVDKRVDLVTVSVAGGAATHAELRSGSQLPELWTVVRQLVASRGRHKKPKVKVSYLLTKQNCAELPGVVREAADAEVEELFATHLDCTPSRELLDVAAFGASGLAPGAARGIEAAAREARRSKLTFRAPTLARQELLVCASDPLSVVFVSWNGRVGPCVHLALPIQGATPRWRESDRQQVEPVIYGDLADQRLREILRGERYRSFTRTFQSRLEAEGRFLGGVVTRSGTETLTYLDEADRQREKELAANAFPGPCAGCHKVVGW